VSAVVITPQEQALCEEAIRPYGIPMEACRPVRFLAGDVVARQGFLGEHLYLIVKGSAHVRYYTEDGKFLAMRHSSAAFSGFIGDLELALGVREFQNSVTAETDMLCLAIPYRTLEVLFLTDVRFSNKIAQTLAKRDVESLQGRAAALGTGEQRLAAYLLEESPGGVFRQPLTHTAAVLGLSYRHLLRILSGLQEDGLLKKELDGYHILKKEALATRM
jgi:CRP-like cAMP-binding protein